MAVDWPIVCGGISGPVQKLIVDFVLNTKVQNPFKSMGGVRIQELHGLLQGRKTSTITSVRLGSLRRKMQGTNMIAKYPIIK